MNNFTQIYTAFSGKTFNKFLASTGLMLLLFGNASFGQTAIYTVASTSSVTTSGTAPSGSTATYSQTFGTVSQMTSGNSATLTLNNYAGYKITGITMSMKSNASAGAGSFTAVGGGSTTFSSIAGSNFNTANWNSAYSSTYVNITPIVTAYTVTTGQSVVLTISCTTNSLYIASYTITYSVAAPTFTSTATGGDWNVGSSWVGGVAPTSGSGATLNIVGPIKIPAATNYTNSGVININTGGKLLCAYTGVGGNSLAGTGTVNVNGTGVLDIEQGGWPGTTNTYVYSSTGTLQFENTSGSYGVNSSDNWWPASSGPQNVTVHGAGGITLNVARTVAGLLSTSATIINPGNITVNGTLQLNSGYGWSGTGNPIYGASSLLLYNSGGSPGRAAEWTASSGTIGTTAGYPNNVQISNNTTLNFPNGSNSDFKANGTLIIDAGSSLYQNYSGGSAGLIVGSDATINGNITLGTSFGDLTVGGNLTVGSSANFTSNGRAVAFNGGANQTIAKTAGGTIGFDYFVINKTAGNVVLSSSPATDVTVNATSGNVLQIINTGGLDLNGRTLALNNTGGGIYVNGARTITSAVAGGKLDINQYKLVANNAGTGSLALATNVIVNLNTNGNLDFGKSGSVYITTLNGTLSINSTSSCFVNTNPPIYGTGSLVKYNSGGTYGRGLEWSTTSGAGYPYDVQVTNSTILNYPNTGAGSFSTALGTVRDLTVDAGSALYMDYGSSSNKSGLLTVGRNISLAGNLSLGDAVGGDLNIGGAWTLSTGVFAPNQRAVTFNGTAAQTITGATTFDYLTLNNSTGLTLNNSVVVNLTLALTSGKITIGTNNLTVGSAGTVTGASISNYVVTAGTGQFKRTVGASNVLFPVGNTAYNPVTFNNSGTSDVYGVRVQNGALTTGANNTKTVSRSWITTEAVAGGSNLSVVAQYNTGEPNTGFAAATNNFIGFYNGTTWTQVAATHAGANPFTVSSNTNLSPSDLTTGTQYFAIGRDNGFRSDATNLVITSITPASPTAGSGFSVTVQAQDAYGATSNVVSSTAFSLTTNGAAGTINGTTTGTIVAGTNSITVSGVILSTPGTGATLTATRTSGDVLTAGTSATFTVLAPASQLAFVGVPSTGNVSVDLTSFTVEAKRPDNTLDNTYTGSITIARASGLGALSGTLTATAVAGVATFSNAQFDAADTYTLSATSGSLTAATSGNIVVTLLPTVIAQFDFTPFSLPTAAQVTLKDANVSVTDFAISAGTLSVGVTTGTVFPNPPYVAGTGGYNATTQATAKNFNFTINASIGYKIEVTSFQFNSLATTAGPSAISYDLGSGLATYTANAPDTALLPVNQTITGISNITSLPVKIQGWLNGSRTSAGSGNFRIDDVIVKGYVTCVQPVAYTVTGGGTGCANTGVAVGLSGSQIGVSYQLKNGATNVGSPVAGTGSAISFGNQTTAATYTVVGSNTNGTCNFTLTMTGSATVTLNPIPTLATITATPACANTPSTVTMSGLLPSTAGTFYYTNSMTGSTQYPVSGTSDASGNFSFNTPNLPLIANGAVITITSGTVTATGCTTTFTGKTVSVVVNPVLTAGVSIVASPSGAVCVGDSVTFTATPTNGGSTPTYQWQVNGTDVSGETASTFTTSSLANGDVVTVVMTSNATPCLTGSPVTSTGVTMTVNSPVTPTFTAVSPICSGDALSALPTTSNNSIVGTWAPALDNTTTTTYTFTPTAGQCATTATLTITVNPVPSASITGNNSPICGGSTASFTLSGTAGAVVTYTINSGSPATVTLTGGTATVDVTGAAAAQTLDLVSVTNGSCAASLTGTSTVSLGATTTYTSSGWDNGTPTSTMAAVISSNLTISADLDACSLTVNSGAAVIVASGYNVTLSGAITVASGSTFTLNNNANLIQGGTTNANSGSIIVKRDTNPLKRQDYMMWSSPVAAQQLLAFSPLTVATRFYTYNTTTNQFNSVTPSTNNFNLGQGYLIRLPNNHTTWASIWTGSFNGVPNNGDVSVALNNVGAGQRFNLVGNPYPSPISMSQLVADNSANITGTFYFWRETNGNTSNNPYCTWAGGAFTSNGQSQVFDPMGVIRTGQGFIIEATATGSSVSFNNGQRVTDVSNQFFRNANAVSDVPLEAHRFWLNLTDTSGAFSQMAAGYVEGATQGVDIFDGKNINNTAGVLLNSIINDTDYTIQGRALPFNVTDVIPLSYKVTTAGNYTIALDHVEGLFTGGAQDIFLKDNLTNTYTNLNLGAYNFASDAGVFTNRFEVVYENGALGTHNPTFDANHVVVYKNNSDIVINTGNVLMAEVKIFDIRGRLLIEKKGINTNEIRMKSVLANEILLVQVTSTEGQIVIKKIVN